MRAIYTFLKNKTVFAIFLTFAVTLFTLGCNKTDGVARQYFKEPFFMDINGEIDGIQISARVYCDPTEHLTKEIYEKMIISFSAPKSLGGVTVTLLSSGKCITRLGDTVSEEYVSEGICDIFEIFAPEKEMTRIKNESGKAVAEYEDERGITAYVFDENGQLIRAMGERGGRIFEFNVKTVENKY